MRATIYLRDLKTGYTAWCAIWQQHIKALLFDGQRLEVEIRPARRNTAQNALLHALLSEIAERVEWAGKKRDVETWKRLMTAAWLRARGESIEVLPAIDGHGIDVVFRRTSSLTKSECAELVDFVQAWAATHGVEFSAEATA